MSDTPHLASEFCEYELDPMNHVPLTYTQDTDKDTPTLIKIWKKWLIEHNHICQYREALT